MLAGPAGELFGPAVHQRILRQHAFSASIKAAPFGHRGQFSVRECAATCIPTAILGRQAALSQPNILFALPATLRAQRFHSSCAVLMAWGNSMTSDGNTSMNMPFLFGPDPPCGYMPLWSIRRNDESSHGIGF